LAESPEVSIVALTETSESRAVELLRMERAVEVKEAMGINLRRGYDKKRGVQTFLKRFLSLAEKILGMKSRQPEGYKCSSNECSCLRTFVRLR
jgi:hypothetical protein